MSFMYFDIILANSFKILINQHDRNMVQYKQSGHWTRSNSKTLRRGDLRSPLNNCSFFIKFSTCNTQLLTIISSLIILSWHEMNFLWIYLGFAVLLLSMRRGKQNYWVAKNTIWIFYLREFFQRWTAAWLDLIQFVQF